MRGEARWSYAEILIIVIVLIVASIKSVPRFTQASQELKTSRLMDGLHQMRSQLELYKAQHEEKLPSADSLESFKTSLTTKIGRYGPYIRRIPENPFNNLSMVRFDGEPAGSGSAGWRLDTKTGLFQADNSVAHAGL